jgi:hypothetical protein
VRSVVAEIEADRGIDASTLAPLPVEEVVAAAATAVAPTPAPFAAPAATNETPEWPQRAAAPATEGPAPFAVPAEPAQVITLTPPAADAVAPDATEITPPAAPAIDPEHLAALEAQVASLEARLVEQDEALRRVLDLLIEWVERDPDNAPNPATSRTWAA